MGTRFLICFLFVACPMVNEAGEYPGRLSNKMIGVKRYKEMKGKLYTHNIILGGNTKQPPFTLAMFVKGNKIYDELQLQVNSMDEVRKLIVLNKEKKIIFYLPVRHYVAISEQTEPGVLVVIDQGKCTRRRYDPGDPRLEPDKENLSEEECDKIMEEVKTETKGYEIDGILSDNQAAKDSNGRFRVRSVFKVIKNIVTFGKINFS